MGDKREGVLSRYKMELSMKGSIKQGSIMEEGF